MPYTFLLIENKQYKHLKRKCERMIEEQSNHILNVNNITVENLDLNSLSSNDIKTIIETVSHNIDSKLLNKLKRIHMEKIEKNKKEIMSKK